MIANECAKKSVAPCAGRPLHNFIKLTITWSVTSATKAGEETLWLTSKAAIVWEGDLLVRTGLGGGYHLGQIQDVTYLPLLHGGVLVKVG